MDIPQARVEEVRPDGVRVKFETGRFGFLDVDLIKPVSEEGTTGILVLQPESWRRMPYPHS